MRVLKDLEGYCPMIYIVLAKTDLVPFSRDGTILLVGWLKRFVYNATYDNH